MALELHRLDLEMEQESGRGGEGREVDEAGPPKHFVQQSPYRSLEAQAPQWRPLVERQEVTWADSQSQIRHWTAEEITETQKQLWSQNKDGPAGCSDLQQNEMLQHDLMELPHL